MSETVTMGVNEDRLLDMLRNSFTNSTTFVGELLQNARRAGASRIDFTIEEADNGTTLTVCDDGRGIHDWSGLVSICDSGWDADTMAEDKPFGIGFLSALCAAQSIDVRSNGKRMCCDTELLISREPAPLASEDRDSGGTSIGLAGIPVTAQRLDVVLRNYIRGFPLPVFLNGDALERPDAIDGKAFVACPIGAVAVSTIGHQPRYYLQGLPVSGPDGGTAAQARRRQGLDMEGALFGDAALSHSHIIHLDSRRFNARLPDRDKLIDMEDAAVVLDSAIRDAMADHIRQMKSDLDAQTFVERLSYRVLAGIGCLDVLNDIPVISHEICNRLLLENEGVLEVNQDQFGHGWGFDRTVSKETIEAAKLVISRSRYDEITSDCDDDDGDEYVAPTTIYLSMADTIVVNTAFLDAGHWIHGYLSTFDAGAVRYRPTGHIVTEHLESDYYRFEATVCDAITMDGPLGEIVVDRWAVPDEHSETVFLPINVDEEAFQAFICFWDGEADQFDQERFNTMTSEFIAQLRAVHSGDMTRVVAATLNDSSINSLDRIRNTRFTLTFDDAGNLTVEDAA